MIPTEDVLVLFILLCFYWKNVKITNLTVGYGRLWVVILVLDKSTTTCHKKLMSEQYVSFWLPLNLRTTFILFSIV